MTQPQDIKHASSLYQDWLARLKQTAMLATHNQAQAMMAAVLQQFRKTMSLQEIAIAAQCLPPLPRGIFMERWSPGEPPVRYENRQQMFRDICTRIQVHHPPPDSIITDVMSVLEDFLSADNFDTFSSCLPTFLHDVHKEG